jgi:ATPase subunit of ABC transporter with duplicated ATPase domains
VCPVFHLSLIKKKGRQLNIIQPMATTANTITPSVFTTDKEIAAWSTNTKWSYNGQVLQIDGSLGFGGDESSELFRDAHITLERSSIYGLVGVNGSGKTSLVRSIPFLPGFTEEIIQKQQFSIEYLAADNVAIIQDSDDVDGDTHEITARSYCLNRVHGRIDQINDEIGRLEDELGVLAGSGSSGEETGVKMEEITTKLGELYEFQDELLTEAENRIDRMFSELHFGDQYPCMPFDQLSAGWKYKCQLISTLLIRPDCFIIDEPSFLDKHATDWLIQQLNHLARGGENNNDNALLSTIVILISHKEALMEELCDRILYLNPGSKTLTLYNCSFREFQSAHADRLAHAKRCKEQTDKDHAQAKSSLSTIKKQLQARERNFAQANAQRAIDKRFVRGKNKEAKQKADHSAASKLHRLEKKAAEMTQQEQQLRETKVQPLELYGVDNTGNDRPLIELVDVSFSYEKEQHQQQQHSLLLGDICGQITGRDKVLIHASNGQGKSTLAKLIIGSLQPLSGEIRRKDTGVIAYFHQDALLELVREYGDATAVDFLTMKDSNLSTVEARTHLGRFGLKGNVATRPIKTLSAGQRTRLWLAREFCCGDNKKPSLLVLDEVTENLDKETTDSLLDSLETFQTAVLAISHDPYFCDGFHATQLWWLYNGRLFIQFQ